MHDASYPPVILAIDSGPMPCSQRPEARIEGSLYCRFFSDTEIVRAFDDTSQPKSTVSPPTSFSPLTNPLPFAMDCVIGMPISNVNTIISPLSGTSSESDVKHEDEQYWTKICEDLLAKRTSDDLLGKTRLLGGEIIGIKRVFSEVGARVDKLTLQGFFGDAMYSDGCSFRKQWLGLSEVIVSNFYNSMASFKLSQGI